MDVQSGKIEPNPNSESGLDLVIPNIPNGMLFLRIRSIWI